MKSFEKVYLAVSQIPKGQVATYKQIALISGVKNPRIVGFAMRANQDIVKVPCHRVVSSQGKLTGYARGGIVKKREILLKEGVPFSDVNTVNLENCLYKPVLK